MANTPRQTVEEKLNASKTAAEAYRATCASVTAAKAMLTKAEAAQKEPLAALFKLKGAAFKFKDETGAVVWCKIRKDPSTPSGFRVAHEALDGEAV